MRNGSGVIRITPIVLNDRYRPKADSVDYENYIDIMPAVVIGEVLP